MPDHEEFPTHPKEASGGELHPLARVVYRLNYAAAILNDLTKDTTLRVEDIASITDILHYSLKDWKEEVSEAGA